MAHCTRESLCEEGHFYVIYIHIKAVLRQLLLDIRIVPQYLVISEEAKYSCDALCRNISCSEHVQDNIR
jgi:hypothetical protein